MWLASAWTLPLCGGGRPQNRDGSAPPCSCCCILLLLRSTMVGAMRLQKKHSVCLGGGSPRPCLEVCAHSASASHTPAVMPMLLALAAVPHADWSIMLDKVKRGQEVVGRDRAVPIIIGDAAAPMVVVGCLVVKGVSGGIQECAAKIAAHAAAHLRTCCACAQPACMPALLLVLKQPSIGFCLTHPSLRDGPTAYTQAQTPWSVWPVAPLTVPPWWLAWWGPTPSCCNSWLSWACLKSR